MEALNELTLRPEPRETRRDARMGIDQLHGEVLVGIDQLPKPLGVGAALHQAHAQVGVVLHDAHPELSAALHHAHPPAKGRTLRPDEKGGEQQERDAEMLSHGGGAMSLCSNIRKIL